MDYEAKALEVGCLSGNCNGQLCEHMTARIAAALMEAAADGYDDTLMALEDVWCCLVALIETAKRGEVAEAGILAVSERARDYAAQSRIAQLEAEIGSLKSRLDVNYERIDEIMRERDHEHELYLTAHRDNMKGAAMLMEMRAERDAARAANFGEWTARSKMEAERDLLRNDLSECVVTLTLIKNNSCDCSCASELASEVLADISRLKSDGAVGGK